jgi:hypothetical protein
LLLSHSCEEGQNNITRLIIGMVELRGDNLYWMREEEQSVLDARGRGRGVMHSRPEQYRRLGIAARQRGAEAADSAVRAAFEEVAANWFALAEQVEWLQGQEIGPFEPSGHS